MTTNGTLITEQVIQRMIDSGMKTISVSVDGLKEHHEWLRQVDGCFQSAIDGIRQLVDSKRFHCVQVTTVVNPRNLGELEELYRLLCELDVDSWKLTGIEPIGAAANRDGLYLSPTEYTELLDFICSKRKETHMEVTYGCSHFLPEQYDQSVRIGHFHCISGISIASISAKGEILGCLDIDDRVSTMQGSIYIDSFWDVWNQRFSIFRQSRNMDSCFCRDCPYQSFCGGDSWHTWDIRQQAPRLCLIQYLDNKGGKK